MTNSLSPLSPLNPLFVAEDCPNESARSRPVAQRSPSFPPSRALRPFPSIAHSVVKPQAPTRTPLSSINTSSTGRFDSAPKRAVKMIEPPKGSKFKGFFVLGMTQAEFRRE